MTDKIVTDELIEKAARSIAAMIEEWYGKWPGPHIPAKTFATRLRRFLPAATTLRAQAQAGAPQPTVPDVSEVLNAAIGHLAGASVELENADPKQFHGRIAEALFLLRAALASKATPVGWVTVDDIIAARTALEQTP